MKPGKKAKKANWTRTAGFVGDDDMERMEEWNREGGGVSEKVRSVGVDPNEDILSRKVRKGVE